MRASTCSTSSRAESSPRSTRRAHSAADGSDDVSGPTT
jgi:hypothetical protein